MEDASANPVVSLRGISKRFGTVQANNAIDLELHTGEIHALLGENGAGKTTLLNILAGVLQPDAGTIAIDRETVTISSPASALRLGIGAVFQHFTLVPNLTVRENLLLGGDAFLLRQTDDDQLRGVLSALGLDEAIDTEVRHLSLGERQRVEIAKALHRNARVLLLDEPTAVLSPAETDQFFTILRQLRQQGVAVVLITHKVEEALAVADRVTVLRQGRVAGERPVQRIDRESAQREIVQLMFGAQPEQPAAPRHTPQTASPALVLNGVTAIDARAAPVLREVSLGLVPGEIAGIAGVDGNGQTELAEVIAGQRQASGGSIVLDGVDITNTSARRRLALGIGYVTDDRLGEGIAGSATVAENIAVKQIARQPLRHAFWLNRDAMRAEAGRLARQFDIRTASVDAPAGSLSGGNIQKLLLARELALQPRVLVCNKPTAGLDLRTAESILSALRAAADAGAAILLISPELGELLRVSDRIAVMFEGRLGPLLPRQELEHGLLTRQMVGLV